MLQIAAYGQSIEGQIYDVNGNKPMDDVIITNVHTNTRDLSDKSGKFSIAAISGHLVEFKKEGYKVIRVRLPQGKLPAFFKVGMEPYNAAVPLFENNASPDYKSDSLKYARLYQKELSTKRITGLDAVKHPFSAMSKKNRMVWAFQEEYSMYQQQKYIDYVFNDKNITSLTGMSDADSILQYKQLFRPTYAQLRGMSEYNFFNYVKRTVDLYRKHGIRARMGIIRSTR